eukprot:scaffold1574_cov256-Chaetoceros_neogracile.AAC.3
MNSISLTLTNSLDQLKILPGKRNILQAQYMDDYVVVYQAYNATTSKQASKQASNKNKLVRDRRGVGDKLEICQKYTVADKKQGDNPKKKEHLLYDSFFAYDAG